MTKMCQQHWETSRPCPRNIDKAVDARPHRLKPSFLLVSPIETAMGRANGGVEKNIVCPIDPSLHALKTSMHFRFGSGLPTCRSALAQRPRSPLCDEGRGFWSRATAPCSPIWLACHLRQPEPDSNGIAHIHFVGMSLWKVPRTTPFCLLSDRHCQAREIVVTGNRIKASSRWP